MNKVRDPRSKVQSYNRILIARLDRIGDVVLSTPVIRAVREKFPNSYIAFMVRPYAYEVVAGNPMLDEVVVYDKKMGFLDNLKFIKFLRKKRFDIAIVLHPTSRTHLLAYFARIPERLGFDRKCGFVLTKKIPHTKQFGLKHEIDYSLDILRHIGIEPSSRSLCMPVSPYSESRTEKIFEERGLKISDTIVALNPGASCRSKRWPAENFAMVADKLAQKYGAKIVLVSGKEDREAAIKTASLMKSKPVDLSGSTTISELASVLKRSKLFISNDSGPVHIACAVGTPVIAIFGRSDRGLSPHRWGPSNKADIAIHKDVGCMACLAHNCRLGFKCLEAVRADDVLEAAYRALSRSGMARGIKL
ncbi:MAG TPA: lipopolysaccharide heptosyltransferase II [Candidatus Omnitrophota bacterium]|nr:lipopolysaccharide heptosyltransferase II [Candidatus Omnitrophota bacterium]